LWKVISDIFLECFALCQKHGLRIYVAYGTEIGAMRHKGYIPWDDDFDVLMPRPDYERFMKLAVEELPKHLKWHSIETDPAYTLPFGKVKDERPEVVADLKAKCRLNLGQGVFVDFFPMDGLPANRFLVFLWNVRRSILRRLLYCYRQPRSWKNFAAHITCKVLGLPKDFHAQVELLQRWISRIDYDSAKLVAFGLEIFRFPRYIWERHWFDRMKMVPFRDFHVPVPSGVEEHLACMYGDYRQLPPVEERVPQHQLIP